MHKKYIKREFLLGGIAIFIALCFTVLNAIMQVETPAVQSVLSKEVIRFHIRANSDSIEDQALKMQLKDYIVQYMEPLLKDSQCIEQSRDILQKNMNSIHSFAEKMVREMGYKYDIKTYLDKEVFPVKTYGDICLPSGEYEALIVEIGQGSGQNWWCIMFPPLCFIDATSGFLPTDSKEQLRESLPEETYEAIQIQPKKPKVKIKIKFKFFDLF